MKIRNSKMSNEFFIYFLLIFEISYFAHCFFEIHIYITMILSFFALYIVPGFFFLNIKKKNQKNLILTIVESFFLSIVILNLITLIFTLFNISLIRLNFSIIGLILGVGNVIVENLKKKFQVYNLTNFYIFFISFGVFILILFITFPIPRYFNVDETLYIHLARILDLKGILFPINRFPSSMDELFFILTNGRMYWIVSLASFKAITGISASKMGLINLYFLLNISLLSTTFVKKIKFKLILIFLTFFNPMLISFSLMAFTEISICFYNLISVYYFIKSFKKDFGDIRIDYSNLILSILGLIISLLNKPSTILFITYFIISLYIYLKYRKISTNPSFIFFKKVFKISLIFFILYEILIDIPFVIADTFLVNDELAAFLRQFIIRSIVSQIVLVFTTNKHFIDILDAFYSLLDPTSLSLIISSVVIIIPLLIWIYFKSDRNKNYSKILFLFISIITFYFFLFFSMNYKVRDTIKSSIFLIPLFIISSTYFFELVIRCNKSRIIFSTLILSIYILFLINSIISNEYGGIYIFGFERVLTLSDLFIFYILFIFILIFFSNKNHRKLSQFKIFNSKYLKTKILKNKLKSLNLKNKKYNFLIIFLVILILFNNFIINFRFLNNSYYFSDDQGLEDFAETLEDYAPLNTIIFGNNYVNMKTFLSDDFIKNTNFVPFPHTEKEFYDYMQNPSINSCFYITNERESTWTDSSNQYIKNYINRDIITSNNKKNLNITEFNLPSPLVKYKFENNGSIIKDLSGYGNDGIPNNISIIDGLSNKSAYFEEELKSYITLNNSNFFNFDQNLSISFTANISSRYGIILSKGNEEYSGSFQINLWNSSLYFNINEVGRIWVENGEMEQLFNSWHQYIFNYNGYIMQIIIDGSIKSEKLVNGKINETDYFINISGDRNRDCCYITGYIDDFQITNHSIEVNKLIELFNKSCYSVFINNKVYYLNEDHTEIVKFYKNINYPQKVNATSLNSEINELNCYAEAKDFFLEFNINSLKESFITILICTKFFTRVINYETNIGINRFNYTISSVGNLHDYSSDKYIFTKLYRFQLIIIENNEIIYNNLVTVQDNYYVLICFLILLLFIFLIALTSYSNLPNLIVKKITKKYTRS